MRQHWAAALARLRGCLALLTAPRLLLGPGDTVPSHPTCPTPAVEGPRIPAVYPGRGGGWSRR